MNEQTKTVQGYFGPKQVTRDEFIKQWVNHYSELYHLTDTVSEFEEMVAMKEKIVRLAGAKWDKMA